jgi:hypothetical protein
MNNARRLRRLWLLEQHNLSNLPLHGITPSSTKYLISNNPPNLALLTSWTGVVTGIGSIFGALERKLDRHADKCSDVLSHSEAWKDDYVYHNVKNQNYYVLL